VGQIVQLLATNSRIDNQQAFLEQVLARERANPTATEYGVTSHARTDLVKKIVLGVGRQSRRHSICKRRQFIDALKSNL
jgi:mannitol/fructose-specific phosphotransferase system IIA component (Ntr-type)